MRERNPCSLKEGHWSTASMPTSDGFPRVQTSLELELGAALWGAEDGVDGFGFAGRAAGMMMGSTAGRACWTCAWAWANKLSRSSNRFKMARVAGSKLSVA